MSHSETDEENLPLTVETTENTPAESGEDCVPVSTVSAEEISSEELPEETLGLLRQKHKNGLSFEEALAVAERGKEVLSPELVWENPLADSVNIRERKQKTAEELGVRFPQTGGCLERASGEIRVLKWKPAWQKETETAAENLREAACALSEVSAEFACVSGLIPPGGTLSAIRDLQNLTGALLAVRGENAELVFGAKAEDELSRLRDAAALAENCARHKSLLSLAYPEDAWKEPELDLWLKWWNEAAFSRAFPRWLKRRKVVASLRKLAGEKSKSPSDPRVDLGNLIAIRVCKKEFAEKYLGLTKTYPSLLPGMEPCGAPEKVAALEKARKAVAAVSQALSCVPEKQEAWLAVLSRWLSGKDPAFAEAGPVEKAFEKVEKAMFAVGAARNALAELLGGDGFAGTCETPEALAAFAAELYADRERWSAVCAWNMSAVAAERRGMAALANAVRTGTLEAEAASIAFDAEYCRRWLIAAAELGECSKTELRSRLLESLKMRMHASDESPQSL
ncbi:MAG: hypothetical protein IKM45_06450 [Opitutales bacterium]|nr:hypothetical protein [Opitutales bacterium]